MKEIILLLAESNGVVCRKFQEILELDGDLEVIGEAKYARAVALAKKVRSALELMEVAKPLLNGSPATCQIPARSAGFHSNPLSSFIRSLQLLFRGCSLPSYQS